MAPLKMTVDRRIYIRKHLLALGFTVIIFTIGILIGIRISDSRVDAIANAASLQKTQFESLQLQYLFLNTAENASCKAFQTTLNQNLLDLENARLKVESYLEDEEAEEFLIAKRDYMITEIRYWLLAKQVKKMCKEDFVTILYFYRKGEVCGDCSAQGIILTYLKERFKDKLLIFSLDADSEEPMVSILKNNYNIEETPTVVIEEKVMSSLRTQEQVRDEICKHVKTNIEECQE